MIKNRILFSEKCYDNNFDELKIIEVENFTERMLQISSINIGDAIYPIDIYLNFEQTEKLIASLTSWVKEVREAYEEIEV